MSKQEFHLGSNVRKIKKDNIIRRVENNLLQNDRRMHINNASIKHDREN